MVAAAQEVHAAVADAKNKFISNSYMPKAIDFLKTLLTKSGANLDDENIKAALGGLNAEFELPDALTTAIDNGLLSVASAKNNHPEIKKHYFAQAYNGLDNELESLMEAEKLPDEIRQLIKQEQSSTKKAILLTNKIKDLTLQKANAGKTDKDELNRQIAELQGQLRDIKANEQKLRAEHEGQLRSVKMSYALNNNLSGYKTVYDDMPADRKSKILKVIIEDNLAAQNAEFTINDNGELVLQTKDGNTLFGKDHNPMTPKMFLDQVLANEKALKVTENSGSQNGQQHNGHNRQQQSFSGSQNGQHNGNHYQNGNNQNGGGKKNTAMVSLIQEAQRNLEQSAGNVL